MDCWPNDLVRSARTREEPMTIEEAITRATSAMKQGVHENWVMLALMADGIHPVRVPVVIRWAKQFNLKEHGR
jgi:hypothetical protein